MTAIATTMKTARGRRSPVNVPVCPRTAQIAPQFLTWLPLEKRRGHHHIDLKRCS